jgi:hypothetical protein
MMNVVFRNLGLEQLADLVALTKDYGDCRLVTSDDKIGHWREVARLTASIEIVQKRLDWTVVDNANKTIQIQDLSTEVQKYHELLYQVQQKYPGESRHDTAKRYIRERATPCAGCRGDSETHTCHEQRASTV